MDGALNKGKNKRNPDRPGRESSRQTEDIERQEADTNTTASLNEIRKQIQSMKNKLKSEFKTFKGDMVKQMKNNLDEFKEEIHQELTKVAAELGEQNEKIDATPTRTEEMEQWS